MGHRGKAEWTCIGRLPDFEVLQEEVQLGLLLGVALNLPPDVGQQGIEIVTSSDLGRCSGDRCGEVRRLSEDRRVGIAHDL